MNIALIGMSGAGKSTLGVLLAKALGMDFIDTDIVIQQREGRLLQEIIDHDGLDRFLMIEEAVILGLSLHNCVIATGGSAVYSESAMKFLRQSGQVIYIHVDYAEIKTRLTDMTARGIVIKKGHSLKDVYEERLPLYMKYGDSTIDCTNKGIERCVGEIADMIKR